MQEVTERFSCYSVGYCFISQHSGFLRTFTWRCDNSVHVSLFKNRSKGLYGHKNTTMSLYKFTALLFSLGIIACTHEKDVQTNPTDLIIPQEVTEEVVEPSKKDVNIIGEWKSKDNSLYPILNFKGKSTIVIKTIMGPFVTSYERDEEFIRVKSDTSDLLFEVVSEDTIKGEGFSKGIWIRIQE